MIRLIGCQGINRMTLSLMIFVGWSPVTAYAQSSEMSLGSQTLGRAYWHVFLAYVIVWLLVIFWLIAINKRLGRIENRIRGSIED